MNKETTKGYTCECGTIHKYPLYVYAHWDEILDHTCKDCNRVYVILHGKATLKESPKKKPKKAK